LPNACFTTLTPPCVCLSFQDGVTYTFWANMSWRPTHVKSRVLDVHFLNWTYAYTNEGEAVCSWCGRVRGLYIN
jgi:hypothetical protein